MTEFFIMMDMPMNPLGILFRSFVNSCLPPKKYVWQPVMLGGNEYISCAPTFRNSCWFDSARYA